MTSFFRAMFRRVQTAAGCLFLSAVVGCSSGSAPDGGGSGGSNRPGGGGGQGASPQTSGGRDGSGGGVSSAGQSAGGAGAAGGTTAGDGAGGTSVTSPKNPIDIVAQVPVLPLVKCDRQNPCVIGACAADTHPCAGDYTIASVAELDAIRACTSVSGDLTIVETELTTLGSLALVAVGGSLNISRNHLLGGYQGLEHLTSVVGDLRWSENGYEATSHPTDLQAWQSLRYVGAALSLDYPFELASLDGLSLNAIGRLDILHAAKLADISALQTLECAEVLNLGGSSELTSLHGLENLKKLGGFSLGDCSKLSDLDAISRVTTLTSLALNKLPALTDLHAFSELVSVGYLSLDTMSLTNLVGLSKLEAVTQRLTLRRNSSLTSLEGLSSLEVIGGEFLISGNNGFPTFEGLESLRIVGGDITLDAASNVQSYQGLSGLEAVGGSPEPVTATGFQGLTGLLSVGKALFVPAGTSLADLAKLEFVGGYLRLDGDYDFSGLAQLNVVGTLWIRGTTTLADLSPFAGASVAVGLDLTGNTGLVTLDGLKHAGALGSVILENNGALRDISALGGLTELTNLTLTGPGPTTLNGLHDLESVPGTMTIRESTLVSLDGLDGLTTLGDVWIQSNLQLQSIAALRGIEETRLAVVTTNPRLPQCAAQEFVDRVMGVGSTSFADGNDDAGVCP